MKYYYAESGETNGNVKLSYGSTFKEKKPMIFSKEDSWFAVAILACGFLYWNLIHFASLSAGVTLFTAIICAVVLIYFITKGIGQTRSSLPWLGLVLISALHLMIYANYNIKQFVFMLLSASFLYWVCISTKNALDSKLSIYALGDAVNQGILLPFSNFTCGYFGIKNGLSKNKYGKNMLYIAAGILVFLPVMVIVISQLSSADFAFEQLVNRVLETISFDTLITYGWQFVFGIPVALYLYGAIYGNVCDRHVDELKKKNLDDFMQHIRFAPKMSIYTALTIFNCIYLAFFISQTTYLFSAFGNVLPDTMTYAEYARRGFFELCKVCTINMMIIIITTCCMKRGEKSEDLSSVGQEPPKLLKLQTGILAVFTILLIVTALSKMGMYIHYYGLTQLRIYAAWFMAVLLFTFVVLVARQIRRFNASKIVILGCITAFLILAYGNVDGTIAKYNIDRYERGTLEKLDYRMLFTLSDAATPYLYEHYKISTNEKEKTLIYSGITGKYSWGVETEPYEKTFRDFNVQDAKADKIRGILLAEKGRDKPEKLSDGKEIGHGELYEEEF